jgi:hypothetical protein
LRLRVSAPLRFSHPVLLKFLRSFSAIQTLILFHPQKLSPKFGQLPNFSNLGSPGETGLFNDIDLSVFALQPQFVGAEDSHAGADGFIFPLAFSH